MACPGINLSHPLAHSDHTDANLNKKKYRHKASGGLILLSSNVKNGDNRTGNYRCYSLGSLWTTRPEPNPIRIQIQGCKKAELEDPGGGFVFELVFLIWLS